MAGDSATPGPRRPCGIGERPSPVRRSAGWGSLLLRAPARPGPPLRPPSLDRRAAGLPNAAPGGLPRVPRPQQPTTPPTNSRCAPPLPFPSAFQCPPQAAARVATWLTTPLTRRRPPRAAPPPATPARSPGRTRFGISWTTRTTGARGWGAAACTPQNPGLPAWGLRAAANADCAAAPRSLPTRAHPLPTNDARRRCMKGFTAGQHKRMEAMWQLHRTE